MRTLICPNRSLRLSIITGFASLITLLALGSTAYAHDDRDSDREHGGDRPPRVPAELQVGSTNSLAFHAVGVGSQIYVWTVNPTNAALSSWVFKAPHAVLFRHDDIVGIHFAGPTWESNSGSKVVGARVASVTVDPNDIPWLLLKASSNSGLGVFADVTYIQRLNTQGGIAPANPGTFDGEEAVVPYIADYFFYHASGS
jgi:hypothetical protein